MPESRCSRTAKASPVVMALVLVALAQPAHAASCMDLETELNTKLEEYGAWSQAHANSGGSVCISMDRLAALMEEAIVFQQQCSAEVDPTGEQLIGYRDTLASIREGQRQLCNG